MLHFVNKATCFVCHVTHRYAEHIGGFVKIVEFCDGVAKIIGNGFQRNQLRHVPHEAVHLVRQAEIAFALLLVGSSHAVCLRHHLAQLRGQLCKGVADFVKLRCKGSESGRNLLAGDCKGIKVGRFQLVGQVRNLADRIESAAKSFKVRCVQNRQRGQSVGELSNAPGHGVEVHAVQAGYSRRNLLNGVHDRVDAFCACGRVDVGETVQKAGDFVQPGHSSRSLFQRCDGTRQLVKAVYNLCDVALCPQIRNGSSELVNIKLCTLRFRRNLYG